MLPQNENRWPLSIASLLGLALFQLALVSSAPIQAQGPTVNRGAGIEMLREIKKDLKEYYYDPTYRGLNLDEHFKAAEQKIKASQSTAQIFGILGQVLIDLNDSHTGFLPPTLVTSVDYGWRMQMFGDRAYVTTIKPGSDAAAKGLKIGDEVIAVDGFQPTRANFRELEYSYYILMPALRLTIGLRDPDGKVRQAEVVSKIVEEDLKLPAYSPVILLTPRPVFRKPPPLYHEANKQTLIVKLRDFEMSDGQVDEMIKRVGSYQNLILDLRGNPGGLVKAIQRMVGYFFDRDIKLAETKGRKDSRAVLAKTRGDKVFKGKLIVLVDSESTSAAEVFARVVQLEKRGTVIGDRTSGGVMTSIVIGHPIGFRNNQPTGAFGVSVTVEDVIMSDGKSLEKVGVTPDEIMVPTARQLADRHDPVLAHAASLFDVNLDPQKAGAIFPAKDQTESSNKQRSGDEK